MSGCTVLSWPASADDAADRLSALLQARRVPLQTRRFPDGELYLRLRAPVRGAPAVVVAHLDPASASALDLWLLADALRAEGATRVVLVLAYLPYMRQDKQFLAGEAVTSRSFARLLSSCVDGLVTVDPHLHRIASLDQIYTVPATVVPSAGAVAAWIRQRVDRPLIIGPDEESEQWVSDVARQVGAPWLALRKRRLGDHQVEIDCPAIPLEGHSRTPVLLDDIISSGHTMAMALIKLRALGLAPGLCVGVHGLFAPGAVEALRAAGAAQVVTCNTLPNPTAEIDVMGPIAQACQALLA